MSIANALEQADWLEIHELHEYRKGTWNIVFDTSNWIAVGSEATPRIFDVPVPQESQATWCVNLIEHLCKSDDEIQLLKHDIQTRRP